MMMSSRSRVDSLLILPIEASRVAVKTPGPVDDPTIRLKRYEIITSSIVRWRTGGGGAVTEC